MTDSSETVYATRSIYCTIGNGDSTYAGAVGMLSCSSNGAAITLLYCTTGYGNTLVQVPSTVVPGGCTAVNLAALPVAC